MMLNTHGIFLPLKSLLAFQTIVSLLYILSQGHSVRGEDPDLGLELEPLFDLYEISPTKALINAINYYRDSIVVNQKVKLLQNSESYEKLNHLVTQLSTKVTDEENEINDAFQKIEPQEIVEGKNSDKLLDPIIENFQKYFKNMDLEYEKLVKIALEYQKEFKQFARTQKQLLIISDQFSNEVGVLELNDILKMDINEDELEDPDYSQLDLPSETTQNETLQILESFLGIHQNIDGLIEKLRPYRHYKKDDLIGNEPLRTTLVPSVLQLKELNTKRESLKERKLSLTQFIDSVNTVNTQTAQILENMQTEFSRLYELADGLGISLGETSSLEAKYRDEDDDSFENESSESNEHYFAKDEL